MGSPSDISVLGSLRSMCSNIGEEDPAPSPAAPGGGPVPVAAAYNSPHGGSVTPVSALSPVLPARQLVVVALDATRDRRDEEIRMAIRGLVARGDILRGGDSLLVLGVLHTITIPKGYQCKASSEALNGMSDYIKYQVAKVADCYQNKLHKDVEELNKVGISVTLKISVGSPAKAVIVQEVSSSGAAWVVLDRHFRRDFVHFKKYIACKISVLEDNLSVTYLKIIRTSPSSKSNRELKALQHLAATLDLSSKIPDSMEAYMTSQYNSSEKLIMCRVCGIKSVLYMNSLKLSFSEIQAATSDFSKDSLLGEGGFGHVYKGQLKDGRFIAAKVRKIASSQGYTEFFSEVQVNSFARHRNIIALLGYCYEESYNILVYEYICNNSLEWHLFDKSASLLEWQARHAIAFDIAKVLRFLHEECRAGPIIHRALCPSNVLLTHEFVPMLGDFGLAKWNTKESIETTILGQSGYLAPEYAEFCISSVKTDVYAFGVLLFQLISGRKVLDDDGTKCTHILTWAEPLVESLALHELIDDRIKDKYDTYGLYRLAKAAYLCVRTNPHERPSMGEVVRLIESDNEHIRECAAS